jgi:hypothetical protein
MRRSKSATLVILLLALPPIVTAQELPRNFTLSKALPADVWFFIHGVHNPEREWLNGEWGEFWQALRRSGVSQDIFYLATLGVPEERRAEVDAAWEKVSRLASEIRWADLAARELVFSERLALVEGEHPIVLPCYQMLCRGTPDSGAHSFERFSGILETFAGLLTKWSLEKTEHAGGSIIALTAPGVPFSFELLRAGDVVGFAFGIPSARQTLSRLGGARESPGIIDTPRFREALALCPPPEDTVMYFDFRALFASLDEMFVAGARRLGEGHEGHPVLRLVRRAARELDLLEFGIFSTRTDELREITTVLTRVRPDRMESPIVRSFIARRPFERFDRFLPADATGFSLTGLVDLGIVYDTVLGFIGENLPDGPQLIERWKNLLAEVKFDPHADLFAWWSGEMISVEMPPAIPNPFGSKDSTTFIRVKDPALARQKVLEGVAGLNRLIARIGQPPIETVPSPETQSEGFVELRHPLLGMFMLRPVLGVYEDWLVIGSGAPAVNRCLAVARGLAPSIRVNPRFRAEGLIPDGPVQGASFADLSRLGEELAHAVSIFGMVGPTFLSGMSGHPEAREIHQVLQRVYTALLKCVPALRELDFFSSQASVSTCEGPLLRTTSVITYRRPPPRVPPPQPPPPPEGAPPPPAPPRR